MTVPQPISLPAGSRPPGADQSRSSGLLIFAAVLFLATRIYLLYFFRPLQSDVIDVYFDYASRVVDLHETPYQGFVQIEYPPVAWWMMAAPRWLAGSRITDRNDLQQISKAYHLYRSMFRSEMFLCDLGSFLLLLLIVYKRRPNWVPWAAFSYVVTTTILAHLLFDRLDIALLFFLMCWAYCWIRSLDNDPRSLGWAAAAYGMLGLSISLKIIPIIGAPFLLLADWRTSLRWVRISIGLCFLVSTAALPFIIQWMISGSGVWWMFTFHARRGIQVESLYSCLMMIGSVFGAPAVIVHPDYSYDVLGAWATPLKVFSLLAQLMFLSGLGLGALLRGTRYTRESSYRATCFVIAMAIILANVLSPQYFIWGIALAILLAVEVLPAKGSARWLLCALLVVVAGTTTWIFPYHYAVTTLGQYGLMQVRPGPGGGGEFSTVGSVVLCVRNATYLVIMIWLAIALLRTPTRTSQSP